MKTIAHLIESTGFYGAERVIINLCSEQLKQGAGSPLVVAIVKDRDTTVDLIEVARKSGIKVLSVRVRNAYWPVDIWALNRELTKNGVDLVHSHGYKASVAARLIKKMSGIPCLATCHLWYQDASTPFRTKLLIAIEQFLYRSAERVVAVSHEIRDLLIRSGVSGQKIEVVPNGIPIQDYRRSQSDADSDGKRIFRILNAGRLSNQKAQHLLVEAAMILKDKGLAFRIEICGEGNRRSELEEKIRAANLEKEVRLLGFQRNIGDFLSRSDIFALPSNDEGMPMALLEAAASQVPIVTTDVGDIGKVVKHEQSGLIIDRGDAKQLADAILRMATDRVLARKLAESAYGKVMDLYSSESMFKSYRRIYSDLIGA